MAYEIEITVRDTSKNESRSRTFEIQDWGKLAARLPQWVQEKKTEIDAVAPVGNREVI